MLDPQGRVASWNPGAERITGYREEEIVGVHFSRFFSSEDVADGRPAQELESARNQGRFEDEGWRICKDGSRFWAGVVIAPMHDTAGQLVGFVKTTRDLTQSRKWKRSASGWRKRRKQSDCGTNFCRLPHTSSRRPSPPFSCSSRARGTGPRRSTRRSRRRLTGRRESAIAWPSSIEALLDVSRIASGRLTLNVGALRSGRARARSRRATWRSRESRRLRAFLDRPGCRFPGNGTVFASSRSR